MIVAAVLAFALVAVVACHVGLDAYESVPVFYPHDPRPAFPIVTISPRPHLYDWAVDDDLIELR